MLTTERRVTASEAEQAAPALAPEWRDYFLRTLRRTPRLGLRRVLGEDVARVLARLVPKDARVLEVGTGSGRVLASLPNAVRHGIDLLPEAVARSLARAPGLEIEVADALSFTAREKYDAIVADGLVHTIPDVQRLLENLVRNLAPSGRVFFTCYNFLWELPIAFAGRLGLREPSPELNWFSESDLENLFALAGVEAVHYEDRMLFPCPPVLDFFVNRVAARLPPFNRLVLYRVYVLRRRAVPRPPSPKVTVVIPARNEQGNIRAAIERTPVLGRATEVVFVEGNSKDDTWGTIERELAAYKGPLELSLWKQSGKGKGDAVRLGFSKATGDLLMILDADLTVPPEELPKFVDVMTRGLADYVHGTRLIYPMESGAMRFLNKLGNAFFAKAFSFLLDKPIQDTLCGTKVLWREDYEAIARNRAYFGDFDPFGDFDLIFGASKLNMKIMEVPVRYFARTYGETNISRFRDGFMLLRMCIFAARKLKFV